MTVSIANFVFFVPFRPLSNAGRYASLREERSEEFTFELQLRGFILYAVLCLKKKIILILLFDLYILIMLDISLPFYYFYFFINLFLHLLF